MGSISVAWLESLNGSIIAYTGLSTTSLLTAVAVGLTLCYSVSYLFTYLTTFKDDEGGPDDQTTQPLPPPVQLGNITPQQLKQYDGSDPNKPLLMAIKGHIYDVSQSRAFYGPGGPYALFAGKDASRALAKMSFEENDLNGGLSGLGIFELEALQDWEEKFIAKYVEVGTVASAPAQENHAKDINE